MNLAIALLIAAAVALWMQPLSILRLHSLRLVSDVTQDVDLIGNFKKRLNRSAHRQQQVQQVIDALAAFEMELRAGQAPTSALVRASNVPPVWPAALNAVGMQGDVVQGLLVDAQGHPELLQLAACWKVAAHSGSGMSAAVHRLTQSMRDAEELRSTLQAELAGPRATAKVLSFLPLIGVLMGIAMGADPVGWLLGNPVGFVCLALGLALSLLGSLWSRRMVRAVEQQL